MNTAPIPTASRSPWYPGTVASRIPRQRAETAAASEKVEMLPISVGAVASMMKSAMAEPLSLLKAVKGHLYPYKMSTLEKMYYTVFKLS